MASNNQPHDEEPVDAGAIVRIGRIAAVDLAAGTVIVEAGEVRTAAIPFSAGRAGKTRVWSPPSVGEQVLLLCPGGDIEGAIAIGAIAQNAFPLAGSTLRELIAFEDGALIAYDPEDHQLDILLPAGAKIRMVASAGVEIEGDVSITGDLAIEGNATITGKLTAEQDVLRGGKSLKSHKHGGIQSGNGLTGEPLA
ncbi:MAG: phage baseplate assembly protein V [Alphaproteobacteria bacterium]|nr:phage baseplate assembly protein V [Alphaproteobacteria bacterium]MBU2342208.1 phage baseplate assembly protein V [Alphaproteobacteria bacterium]